MAYLTGSRSSFPDKLDKIKEKYDLSPRQLQLAKRYQELKTKENRTSDEEEELNNLTIELQDFIYTAEDMNKAFDVVIATQKHYRDNTIGHVNKLKQETKEYVDNKKNEVKVFVDGKVAYIVDFTNQKVVLIERIAEENIEKMDDKRRYFVKYVDTKVDEVQNIVQEFHTDTKRYYTTWVAKKGQVDFNIFQGSNENLPPEANLNIPPENIDLMINGVLQTPYQDYVVHNNGFYDTIRLTSNAQSLIQDGTELVAKWYKNVGKLYFQHSHSHEEGGYDEITVTKGMLDDELQDELKNIVYIGSKTPNSNNKKIWIDTSI